MPEVKQKRKSCALARVLSILLPGLGSIYAGEYFTGVVWMLPGLVILGIEAYLLKLMIIGVLYANRAWTAIVIINVGYFIYSVYSSKDASSSAAQFNARQALLENKE